MKTVAGGYRRHLRSCRDDEHPGLYAVCYSRQGAVSPLFAVYSRPSTFFLLYGIPDEPKMNIADLLAIKCKSKKDLA